MDEKRSYFPPCFFYPCILNPYRLSLPPSPCLIACSVHPPPAKEEELQLLEEIRKHLEKQIEIISSRIEEIEKTKARKTKKSKK